ncbi:MAG: hypothetical protein OXU21_05040 [Chloroflexota bacterium]|nr:hypothetical protein [Chloroflexota bacterium]
MERPVRVAVVGEGPAARRFAVAAASVADVDLVPVGDAQALILADAAALAEPAASAIASAGVPTLIDPGVLVSLGATPESRAALRDLRTPAITALPWRHSPAVRLARRLLEAPKFIHAQVALQGDDSLPVAALHTLDILTHLMGRSPSRVYAESAPGESNDPASQSSLAGTLEFGAGGCAAVAVSRLGGATDRLTAVVQLTDGRKSVTLSEGFTTATLAGFDDADTDARADDFALRAVGRSHVVTVDWRPIDGLAEAIRNLVQTVRAGQAPRDMVDLPSALRSAALVRAALAAAGSGRPRRLVAR